MPNYLPPSDHPFTVSSFQFVRFLVYSVIRQGLTSPRFVLPACECSRVTKCLPGADPLRVVCFQWVRVLV